MTRYFSGWHMTAVLVGFFGVVIAVNSVMATLAVRTFGGTVVDNSYVASQEYNSWLAAARKQQQLGWTITPKLDAARRVDVSTSVDNVEITGFARHPLGREADIPLTFIDHRSVQALPPGRWAVHLLIRRNGQQARLVETLS